LPSAATYDRITRDRPHLAGYYTLALVHLLRHTSMYTSQPPNTIETPVDLAQQTITECDRKIANYRALIDAGTDPNLIAGWIAETTAARAAAQAQQRSRPPSTRQPRLTRQQIRGLITAVGDLRAAIRRADLKPMKSALYQRLRVRLTYDPGTNSVRAEADLGPDAVGIGSVSEGGLEPPRPLRALAPQASASAIPPPGPTCPRYPVSCGRSPSGSCPAGRTAHYCTPAIPIMHSAGADQPGWRASGGPGSMTGCRNPHT
jgi:hypothetical protein